MTFPPVLTKRDMVVRYHNGEFGNHSPTWNTLDEWKQSWGYHNSARFHIRNRVAGGQTHYNIEFKDLEAKWNELEAPEYWYISAMAPHDRNLIQGEFLVDERGWQLTYSTVPGKPMREALAEKTETAEGILAISLLRHYLCPNSYDWMMELLRRYPGHCVEFSTFGCKWGTLYPLFNSVFWEVRSY